MVKHKIKLFYFANQFLYVAIRDNVIVYQFLGLYDLLANHQVVLMDLLPLLLNLLFDLISFSLMVLLQTPPVVLKLVSFHLRIL